MDNHIPDESRQNWENPTERPEEPALPAFATGAKELIFGVLILIFGMLLCNSVLYGGFHLGFAIFSGLTVLCTAVYLLLSGHKLTFYSGSLLVLSLVICAGFGRSDDGFVKFMMVCFLLVSVNLGLCLQAGQNLRNAAGVKSLLDVPRTLFVLGVGRQPHAWRGLIRTCRSSSGVAKKGGSVMLGLVIAVPLLAILIPLLVSADAAFDALLQKLPDWDFGELFTTVFFGTFLVCVLYVRGVALHGNHSQCKEETSRKKGMNPATVNTVLAAVALVYVAYLVSQLSYFFGGFMGLLPAEYTMAEYARRGFFEMAWICAINLSIIALAVGLVKKERKAPLSTRLLCLFIGIVTLLLVATASAKMFLYIDAYGLTRLRVLTEVIMIWLGITTAVVTVWLFMPKLPYMKAVLLCALLIGATVFWADVDTVTARYNVSAYLSGKMETVDVWYLSTLGDGAVPYLQQLTVEADSEIAQQAREAIERQYINSSEDFRGWNYVNHKAEKSIVRVGEDTERA